MMGVSKYEPPSAKESKSELVKRAKMEKWSVWGLEGGLSTLTEALAARVAFNGVEIITSGQVKDMNLSDKVNLNLATQSMEADLCVMALPSYEVGHILPDDHVDLKDLLMSIPYVDVGVVNVEYAGNLALKCGDGFGLLVPSSQKDVPILGIIFDTCTFPQGDRTIFTVMMGGSWFKSLFGDDPDVEELEELAIRQIDKILGIRQSPIRVLGKIHRNAIAQYTVGHKVRLKAMRDYIKAKGLPIRLVGSAFDGVGLNDAILSSRNQLEDIL